MYLWTNFLCISHNHILVHLGCHLITKTKQGPFNVGTAWGMEERGMGAGCGAPMLEKAAAPGEGERRV